MSREQLSKEVEELEREVSSLQQKILTERIETSTSKDARKMYGDTTPGDITHQDVTLEYSGFFKNAFRSLPKGLKEDMDKYRIWEMCADIMKTSYEVNRDDVVDEMIKKMKDSLVTNETCSGSEEDRIDALRAFTFLLHQIPIEELRAQCLASCNDEEAADVAMDILTLLPGTDHKSLIINNDRLPPPPTTTTGATTTQALRQKEEKCKVCGKLLTRQQLSDSSQVIRGGDSLYFHVKCCYCYHCKSTSDLRFNVVEGDRNPRLVCGLCSAKFYDLVQ